ncbi:hypothetical protein GOBAR_AA33148 [Gossypium barbadense]|uniref:Uncharacterized protein n=1 Tax=Gossypium barbadense TaxID=3634 RepID=A0A2P5W8W9_GOSBA|nr:hypothetical protein GOBAR_AA33148 [Gossypium barbadense]
MNPQDGITHGAPLRRVRDWGGWYKSNVAGSRVLPEAGSSGPRGSRSTRGFMTQQETPHEKRFRVRIFTGCLPRDSEPALLADRAAGFVARDCAHKSLVGLTPRRSRLPRARALIRGESAVGVRPRRVANPPVDSLRREGERKNAFRTPPAPYEKSKSLGSGGSMVARLKLKGIDGRAPPGVEPAA